jgi:hypothetical protein
VELVMKHGENRMETHAKNVQMVQMMMMGMNEAD